MMKKCLLVAVGLAAWIGFGAVEVGGLPAWEFADTEVSTNVPFAFPQVNVKHFFLSMELAGTPSNNVQVAFGRDANTNGVLEVEEAGFAIGWDCGEWRVRGCLGSLEGLGGGRVEKTFVLKRRQLDTAWNLVKVTRRGCGAACELVEAKGRKPGFKLEMR